MSARCYGAHRRRIEAGLATITETWHSEGLETPAHRHPTPCLHLVLRGVYQEASPGEVTRAVPGEVLFKPSEALHWNDFSASGSTTLRVELDPAALDRLDPWLPSRPRLFRAPALTAAAGRLRRELDLQDDLSSSVADALTVELCVALARHDRGPGPEAGLVPRAVDLLERRFQGPFGLGGLAAELGVDSSRLAHAFREALGRSVGEWLRERRCRYVAEVLLAEDRRPLAELALDAGFADQSHLTRTFRALYGAPPGRWRRAASARSSGAAPVQDDASRRR